MQKIKQLAEKLLLLNLPGRLPGLEGIRGLAALLIFLASFGAVHSLHAYYVAKGGLAWNCLATTLQADSLGIDLFFILSGFLITLAAAKGTFSFTAFMGRRFARLMPAHLAVLTLRELGPQAGPHLLLFALPLYAAAQHLKLFARFFKAIFIAFVFVYLLALAGLVAGATTVHNFIPWLTGHYPWTTFAVNLLSLQHFFPRVPVLSEVTWTLCLQFVFYFGLAFSMLAMRGRPAIVRLAFSLIVAALFYSTASAVSTAFRPYGMQWIASERFAAFFFGIALAWVHGSKHAWKAAAPLLRWLSPLMLLALPAMQYAGRGAAVPSRGFVLGQELILVTILGGLLIPGSLVFRIFSQKFFRVLGSLSYATFLVHDFVIARTYKLFVPFTFPRMVVHFITAGALTAALAFVFFLFVERPYFTGASASDSAGAAGKPAAPSGGKDTKAKARPKAKVAAGG